VYRVVERVEHDRDTGPLGEAEHRRQRERPLVVLHHQPSSHGVGKPCVVLHPTVLRSLPIAVQAPAVDHDHGPGTGTQPVQELGLVLQVAHR